MRDYCGADAWTAAAAPQWWHPYLLQQLMSRCTPVDHDCAGSISYVGCITLLSPKRADSSASSPPRICLLYYAARENVVGWYHTGPRLRAADLDISALMCDYCDNPTLVICEVEVRPFPAPDVLARHACCCMSWQANRALLQSSAGSR